MRVHLGSDHAGLELKKRLAEGATRQGDIPVDHGPVESDPGDDYPVFCLRAAQGVATDAKAGLDSLGVVVGGSGNGEQIAANKVDGVRAALVWSDETAELARQHNDANVISVGARMPRVEALVRFTGFSRPPPSSGDQRHAGRIGMPPAYETPGDLPPLSAAAGPDA